jgi:MinD-like ATPase involved in chromosome partitioning or flagellar assembly
LQVALLKVGLTYAETLIVGEDEALALIDAYATLNNGSSGSAGRENKRFVSNRKRKRSS